MPIANTLMLFARWLRRPRPSARLPEPADLGTAFGMECWLEDAEDAAQGLPPAHAEAPRAPVELIGSKPA